MSEPIDKLTTAFHSAGWLIDKSPDPLSRSTLISGCDLLPMLHDSAVRSLDRATSVGDQQRAARLVRLCDWLMHRGAMLTRGFRDVAELDQSDWIGERLIFWPSGIIPGRKVAWVSSRLGQAICERPDWFAVLRTAAAKMDSERDVLLSVSTTTTDRFLERAAILFDLRLLRIQLSESSSLVDWLTRLRRSLWREFLRFDLATSPSEVSTLNGSGFDADQVSATVSPLIVSDANVDVAQQPLRSRPLADRVLMAMADRIVALQIRPNGNLHDLLRRRLSASNREPGSVWLAWGEQLVPPEVVSELQSLGAVSWHLQLDERPVESSRPIEMQSRPSSVLTEWPWDEGDYLLHWTRRRSGAWPDQSPSDFVDELLLSREANSSSAFASLARIVRQRLLIASATNIRGGFSVVSFSAISIGDFLAKRTFRKHRHRFDFEPFGIALRREWLIAQGARPVRYGDDLLWSNLSDDEQPFFQLQKTRGRKNAAVIDWSQEAEWRIVGNVDLAQAYSRDIVLFVPTTSDATSLATISPWPVIAVSKEVIAPDS